MSFFDGTLWRDDELTLAGIGAKTGTRMGHMNIDGRAGTLDAFADLNVRRKVFIHINTNNPILDPTSDAFSVVRNAGWDVAHDGMEWVL